MLILRSIPYLIRILLDYGPDWEREWKKYKQQWKNYALKQQSQGNLSPLTAQDMRERYRHQTLETRGTISEALNQNRPHPYPQTVGIACYLRTEGVPDGQPMVDSQTNYGISIFRMPASYDEYAGEQLVIVDVLDRVPVLFEPSSTPLEDQQDWFYNYTVVARVGPETFELVKDVPHRACTFVDKPYTSDVFKPGAFRHKIGILDDQFPQAWRDLRI